MSDDNKRYGIFSEKTLRDYWCCVKNTLAEIRNWEPTTIENYSRYISYLNDCLDKNISSITMDDIKAALAMLSVVRNYCDSTLRSVLSMLRVVFKYAYEHGDAYNIFHHYKLGKQEASLDTILCSSKNMSTKRAEIQREREKLASKPKSLNVLQIETLVRYLWDKITTDGRLCLIALMLYCGVRPAEGRALLWGDIKAFLDHPDREFICLIKIRDKNGILKDAMKTPNAYRRIPLHIELAAILRKRRDYIIAVLGRDNIDDLPICCLKNDFERPCKDWEVAMVAEEIFDEVIKVSKEVMSACAVEHVSDMLEEDKDVKEVQHLVLYVLRKNFWTWMQALTTLSDEEKYVLMGHELETEKRELFNNENRLWNMCRKLDKAVLSKMLHEEHLYISPQSSTVCIDDCGIFRIRITKDMLCNSNTCETKKLVDKKDNGEPLRRLFINLVTEEPGDNIYVRLRNPSVELFEIGLEVATQSWPTTDKKGINCSYANWLAHEAAEKSMLKKAKKLEKQTTPSEYESADENAVQLFDNYDTT